MGGLTCDTIPHGRLVLSMGIFIPIKDMRSGKSYIPGQNNWDISDLSDIFSMSSPIPLYPLRNGEKRNGALFFFSKQLSFTFKNNGEVGSRDLSQISLYRIVDTQINVLTRPKFNPPVLVSLSLQISV